MTEYRVTLIEEPGETKFEIFFVCMADDEEHAVEQALDAYPGSQITCVEEE